MTTDNEEFLAPLAKTVARRLPRPLALMLMVSAQKAHEAFQAVVPDMLLTEMNLCRWVLHEVGVPLAHQEEVLSKLQAHLALLLMRYVDLVARDEPLDETEARTRREIAAAKSPADVLRAIANAVEGNKGS